MEEEQKKGPHWKRKRKITIITASYGITNHSSDVLTQTIQLVNKNILDFKVSNTILKGKCRKSAC